MNWIFLLKALTGIPPVSGIVVTVLNLRMRERLVSRPAASAPAPAHIDEEVSATLGLDEAVLLLSLGLGRHCARTRRNLRRNF